MLTDHFTQIKLPYGYRADTVGGKPAPEHLGAVRIPPAWTDVRVDPDPSVACVATGVDEAGRRQRLYSAAWIASARAGKFERVRGLLTEMEDIRTQIEADLNDPTVLGKDREAALVTYLIYETGMRPGSACSARGDASQDGTEAYGATTVQLRHIKSCARGVRLKFIGKKGVSQNVLVTNPYLVGVLEARKAATTRWSKPVFNVSSSKLNGYIASLGSGAYTAKDLRTARGTSLALELLGNRKRLPKALSRRKKIVNEALDRVAAKLGNTRAISRKSYVDPEIIERILEARTGVLGT